MTRTGQTHDADFDLDFHAIMHFGDDVALETHYVPRRSQRTEAVLSFFAQDGETRNLVYANAACTNADQASQAIAFARHGKTRPVSHQRCWCSTRRSRPAPGSPNDAPPS